ncbi:MAG: helix-turn-helix domain-containing protein [Chloroflexi bacterium]|nr:helix-turn-helix domain-containing protein [Chloroflexota bacterium]
MVDRQTPVLGASRSADRALRVLDLLERRSYGLPTMVVARECDIPKSSAHQLLNTMRDRGFVKYDHTGRTWAVGDRAREIGAEVPTIPTALQILESFDRQVVRQTAASVAQSTGLDLERVQRTLSVLEAEGLVAVAPGGLYSLGLRTVRLAARIEPIELLRTIALPLLSELRDLTGETANLLVQDGTQSVFLDQVESPRALRHSGWAGRTVPLIGTAGGAALSGLGGAQVAADAVEAGITAVACRISWSGHPPAAVSITAPSFRLVGSDLKVAMHHVEVTAARIGAELTAQLASSRSRAAVVGSAPEPTGTGEMHRSTDNRR